MPMMFSRSLALVCGVFLFACERPDSSPPPAPEAKPQLTRAEAAPDVAPAPKLADSKNREVAILAGGCFWGMEQILREVDGVLDTEVGYTGGASSSPDYDEVKKGNSGHAESVRVVFDPTKLSYADLLEQWFFRMHDPTTKNRQGNDVGTQYRSAIFFTSAAQEATAREVIQRVEKSGQWHEPIVTQVVKARPFTPAEDYHQDYLVRNPSGYTCHYLRDPVY